MDINFDNPAILEFNEIVGVYELVIDGLDERLKIKVIKHGEGRFMGVANLEVNGYRSLTLKDTKEEALRDAVTGFFAFYTSEAKVKKSETWWVLFKSLRGNNVTKHKHLNNYMITISYAKAKTNS